MKKIVFIFLLLLGFYARSQKTENKISKTKIDTTEVVLLGEIKQFISIKGNNIKNPILLLIHGGPGSSLIPANEKFTERLLNDFTIVNWDQRATGETAKLNSPTTALNTALIKKDAIELITYLLKKFAQEKLFLVSHSWGSVIGFDVAQKHPELLYAFIPISAIIDQEKASIVTIDMLKKWAIVNKNEEALKELSLVQLPFEKPDDLFYTQKWLFIHNGVDFATEPEFKTKYYDWLSTWFEIWKESIKNSLFETLPKIDCPIYFIEGNGDKQKSHNLVKEYYTFLKTPKKKLFWMRKSGHTVFNSEPEKLQKVLLKIKKTTIR